MFASGLHHHACLHHVCINLHHACLPHVCIMLASRLHHVRMFVSCLHVCVLFACLLHVCNMFASCLYHFCIMFASHHACIMFACLRHVRIMFACLHHVCIMFACLPVQTCQPFSTNMFAFVHVCLCINLQALMLQDVCVSASRLPLHRLASVHD
eukprot:Pompholyxophrys_punicea_v1_NODE_999_length_1054_cov_2.952953.p1 type:complete len:154 gc:universal NODE_999_length_1054_cov_2.952953:434-895(+)